MWLFSSRKMTQAWCEPTPSAAMLIKFFYNSNSILKFTFTSKNSVFSWHPLRLKSTGKRHWNCSKAASCIITVTIECDISNLIKEWRMQCWIKIPFVSTICRHLGFNISIHSTYGLDKLSKKGELHLSWQRISILEMLGNPLTLPKYLWM